VTRDATILGRVMLAFEGDVLPARIAERLAAAPAAGMTLFRFHNVRSPGQVLELTTAFQRAGAASPHAAPADFVVGGGTAASAAAGRTGAGGTGVGPGPRGTGAGASTGGSSPMLVAADQEGGQFLALGDGPTAFAGSMALGAVDDEALTERVGFAIGLEARSMGVNAVYAPVLDLATNPANPALGIRSFGDSPAAVGRHGAAMVRGLQAAGVAATVKHAPGKGHVSTDTHHGLAVVDAARDVLEAREFVPFRAAFAAGARLAMSGHGAVPAISGRDDLPATLSRAVMTDLLRRELGFKGVTISDALDMGALAQGPAQVLDVLAAIHAGVDLLLAAADPVALARIEETLVRAVDRELLDPAEMAATERRVAALRTWLGSVGPAPDLSIVGCADHLALATELAERSITLVRDPSGLLPLMPSGANMGSRRGPILAVMPRPADLTPADTSSTVAPGLAAALRRHYPEVDEMVVDQAPDRDSIAAVRDRAALASAVVVGTIDGHRQPAQIDLVEAIAATGTPVVAVALRGPWDVAAYPPAATALATYSILPASLQALAAVLAGEARAPGRLPVAGATGLVEVPA
jgi:beta-N-acetylhexosaminidase